MRMQFRSIFKVFFLALVYVAVLSCQATAAPYISSQNYCLMDGHTGQVIKSNSLDELRPVASTTKMMTAILTVEYADLDEIAVVSENASKTPEYNIGLQEGQEISINELLKISLLRSANDAAVVLAEHIAGDEGFFAHLMSKKAFVIGAVNTNFINASGLPADGHYSTAYDLCQLGRYLLGNATLKELVATKQTEFQHPGYQKSMVISNTNNLLYRYEGADGIKTGTTNAAGKCLVASATRNGRQYIATVLKSGDRTGDCGRLLNYAFDDTFFTKYIDKETSFKELKILNGESPYVEIFPQEDLFLIQSKEGPDIQKEVFCNYMVEAPVSRGQKIGSLRVYACGKLVNTIDLISGQNIAKEYSLIAPAKRFLLEKGLLKDKKN